MILRLSILTICLGSGLVCADIPTEAYDHWAWKSIKKPVAPQQTIPGWDHPIDRFVAQKLTQEGLTPSPPAQPRDLLRRAKFDLLGLPTSFEEAQSFNDIGAFNGKIAEYLSKPEYGERWGRHWLDVARYSDTAGEVPANQEAALPFAYTYRDYVIQSFNDDRPFDQFIIDQIAADLRTESQPKQRLAALGFLTVGDRRLNRRIEIIDDQIDVITRGTMGLTVSCSRCHDHKYDPIPTADYYSMYGVMDSSREPKELPIIGKPSSPEAHKKYLKRLLELEADRDKLINETGAIARADVLSKIAAYIARAQNPSYEKTLTLRRGQVRRWSTVLKTPPAQFKSVLGPARAIYSKSIKNPQQRLQQYLNKDAHQTNLIVRNRLKKANPSSFPDLAAVYGELLTEALARWQKRLEKAPEAKALQDTKWEEIRQLIAHPESPIPQTAEAYLTILGQSERDKVRDKQKAIDGFIARSPGAPPRAMVLYDSNIVEPVIFKRGDQNNRGEKVPRQFPAIVSTPDRKPFTSGSGRLEMAQAIASAKNPLTARVIVNRVWHWHFGRGLVGTVDNFGLLGDKPTHPELLDYLATAFIKNGWSLKWLHQHVMSSKTYQQASTLRADAHEKDPENRLLWRFSRKRLEYEAMRDSILSVSGTLSTKRGGQPFKLEKTPYDTRRSVYAFIDRNELTQALTVFDFASPSASTGLRPKTTVPQQALYMLNSNFILTQAKTLAMSESVKKTKPGPARIRYLFNRILARNPSQKELQSSLQFCRSYKPGTGPGAYVQLTQTLMCSNEFTFVD